MKYSMFTKIPETEVTITYNGTGVTYQPFANNSNLSTLREEGKVVFRKMLIGDDAESAKDTWVALRADDESKFDDTTNKDLIPCMTVDEVFSIGLSQYVYIVAAQGNGKREFFLDKLDYSNSTYVRHTEVWSRKNKKPE